MMFTNFWVRWNITVRIGKLTKQSEARTNLYSEAWKKAVDDMVKRLRLKQRSYRTEQTYLGWLRDFYRFNGDVSPNQIDDRHLMDYLTYLQIPCPENIPMLVAHGYGNGSSHHIRFPSTRKRKSSGGIMFTPVPFRKTSSAHPQ
jgi:hypothetical protein